MRRMEMRKNNLAAENRNLKGNANRWTSGKKIKLCFRSITDA